MATLKIIPKQSDVEDKLIQDIGSRPNPFNSVPKKTGLLKTLAIAMILGISTYFASCSDFSKSVKDDNSQEYVCPQEDANCQESQVDYTGAIVFTYSSKEFPQETIEELCNTNSDSMNSYFYVPVWQKTQADNYNAKFNLNLTCYPEQIKIPAKFMNPKGSPYPVDPAVLSDYLRRNYSVLKDYDFIAINHFLKLDGEYDYFFYTGPSSFFLATLEDGNLFITPPTQSNFAHEFNHLMGATDKYNTTRERACIIDPETGKEYDGHDIMCHRIHTDPNNPRSNYMTPLLEKLIISEPTAEEIDWLK